jgi:predicted GIY-YIG superfamily endonuclease
MIPPFILFIRKNLKIAQLREAQIKRWSRAKKEALIAGDFNKLNQLAKPRSGEKRP